MTVAEILADKGRTVVTIQPGRTLAEAVGLLAERRIGALVVLDDREAIAGIVSERDVVRALASVGAAALDHAVSKHMTAKVVTCASHAAIDEVTRLMTEGRFRHLPVVDGGRLTGVVSIGDVVKTRLAEVEADHEAMRSYIATA